MLLHSTAVRGASECSSGRMVRLRVRVMRGSGEVKAVPLGGVGVSLVEGILVEEGVVQMGVEREVHVVER